MPIITLNFWGSTSILYLWISHPHKGMIVRSSQAQAWEGPLKMPGKVGYQVRSVHPSSHLFRAEVGVQGPPLMPSHHHPLVARSGTGPPPGQLTHSDWFLSEPHNWGIYRVMTVTFATIAQSQPPFGVNYVRQLCICLSASVVYSFLHTVFACGPLMALCTAYCQKCSTSHKFVSLWLQLHAHTHAHRSWNNGTVHLQSLRSVNFWHQRKSVSFYPSIKSHLGLLFLMAN
jgi:hypothetical protein